ncbi:glutaminase family protein [Paenibacillus glycinis]|nr:glutaminase family protein [Paenibacillus glycinis]
MLRPPAVPLVTVDPFFSVWSTADRLTDDFTRHWTGQRHAMTGLLRIDGTVWRFAGKAQANAERYYAEPPAMEQTSLTVTPLSTIYAFEAAGTALTVRFTTPLLLDDLDVLSRPASYVSFALQSLDGGQHDVQLYFDVTGEWCVDQPGQSVVRTREETGAWLALGMSHDGQSVLNRSGDDHRIDWGTFYLAAAKSDGTQAFEGSAELRKAFVRNEELIQQRPPSGTPSVVGDEQPVMALVHDFGRLAESPAATTFVLAYDDVYAVEYFGDKLQAYWKRDGQSTPEMLTAAFSDYEALTARCAAFDRQLLEDATASGGAKYADLLALSYRQAIAAHKLVTDTQGELLFLSKECYSNGCMATVDVSYPSVPLFLLYRPELVEAMLRPILRYAQSDLWPFEFAPHDIGQYPLGNGQVYSDNAIEGQMPVEECGNMLIMAAAVCLAGGKPACLLGHMKLLKQWADYLAEHGLDPENQLCTDDFAGHLARNANLSVKAVMGVASYAILAGLQGDAEAEAAYRKLAREMAAQWETLAADGECTKLAFGHEGSWSLKYNLIWDVLFGTELFAAETLRKETAWYLKRGNVYGTPLDSRATYTKSDWVLWSAALAEERSDFIALMEPIWTMLNETPDRVPFSDWTDTLTARQLNFQHRSVVGGIFMKLLRDKGILLRP